MILKTGKSLQLFAESVFCWQQPGIIAAVSYTHLNILQVLDLAQIPLEASQRTKEHPFVIGGGPCTYNPEPLADFFDLFYIGEGEVQYDALLDLYKEWKVSDASREDFLKKASQIPGIYVPSLYSVSYKEDGTIDKMIPLCPEAPEKVKKQLVLDVTTSSYPEKPVIPFIKATQDLSLIHICKSFH